MRRGGAGRHGHGAVQWTGAVRFGFCRCHRRPRALGLRINLPQGRIGYAHEDSRYARITQRLRGNCSARTVNPAR